MEDLIIDEMKDSLNKISFENVHIIAEYLYNNLDISVVEGLLLELEAQIRFGDKK